MQGLELVLIYEPDQQADCHPAEFLERLVNGCEPGISSFGFRRIVEADDGQVFREPEPSGSRCVKCPDGHAVIEGENRCGRGVQREEMRGTGGASRDKEVRLHLELRVRHDARFRQSGVMPLQSSPGGGTVPATGDDPDPAVP